MNMYALLPQNQQYDFPKMRGGVKGRLELFREFIRFCRFVLPSTMITLISRVEPRNFIYFLFGFFLFKALFLGLNIAPCLYLLSNVRLTKRLWGQRIQGNETFAKTITSNIYVTVWL